MKDKNKKLIIVVASLLLVVGVTFAYFTASTIFGGNGANVSGTTATLEDSVLSVEGSLEFNDTNIYPGHKNVSSIKATATGDNTLIPYNVIWEGENTLNTPLNYTVYKTTTEIEVSASCEAKNGVVDGARLYYEECTISNQESLGSIVSSGTIAKGETKKTIIPDEFITSSNEGTEVYYYVILEYPNLEENQNSDIGGSFSGKVLVELNDTEPDIIIAGTYIEEDGEYKEVEDIPTEGYELNTSMSTCTNNATVGWDKSNKRIYIESLSNSGTECTLYYDEYEGPQIAKEAILAGRTVQTRVFPVTRSTAVIGTNNQGDIYSASEGNGTTYYFAGNPTDNWIQFGGFYWRIIRINSDGSIRMIYSGDAESGPVTIGTDTQITVDGSNTSAFNTDYNASYYVGLKYTTSSSANIGQHGVTTNSTILEVLNKWYENNMLSFTNQLTIGTGFCGDRDMASGSSWSSQPSSAIYYAAYERIEQSINNVMPTFDCSNASDLYTTSDSEIGNKSLNYPIGLITADEVAFAGLPTLNPVKDNYLYTGQYYWTMTPTSFLVQGNGAFVYYVNSVGSFGGHYVYFAAQGVRPVISLRSDVLLSGSGTITNPYVVVS